MTRAISTLALVWLLVPATASAQEIPPLRLLPEYTPCVVNTVRYACYTAEQQAALNALEAQAQGWERQLRLSEGMRLQLDALVVNLQAQVTEYQALDRERAEHIANIQRQLEAAITEKNDWRARAESTDPWPIIIGAAVGVLGVGFGIGALVLR